MHHLSRADAQRIAVRAQLLTGDRPGDLVETVTELTMLQIDPVTAIAPAQHLIAWSRIGSAYDPGDLDRHLEQRTLIELLGFVRPAEDIGLYRAEMAHHLTGFRAGLRRWVEANDQCRQDILEILTEEGPTPTGAIPDTTALAWKSSGWTNDKNVSRLLELMVSRGEVALAGRENGERLWDLADRVYPDVPVLPLDEAITERNRRRLAALGIARATAPATPHEPNHVGEAGEEAQVEGLPGTWRVDPAYLDASSNEPRAALLCPVDRLIFDRTRMELLFDFEYLLEMYKPKAKRRWGYYALPILWGDELVGKLDAAADRKSGVLRVNAVHQDGMWTTACRDAVHDEIDDLARWLDLDLHLRDL